MCYDIEFSCVSNIGNVRKINQDNFICNNQYIKEENVQKEILMSGNNNSKKHALFGIFDGMGGEERGEVASYIAAKEASFIHYQKDACFTLEYYCKEVNEKICKYAKENNVFAMGTTAAILLFYKDEVTLCNIGDSKIFHFTNGNIKQLSKDHIAISAYGKKPPLSQNLGIPPEQLIIEPYLSQGRCKNGDKYLICSDGLTDMLSTDEIKAIVENFSTKESALQLTNRALENGGKDNITVIVLEVKNIKNRLFKIFDKNIGGIKNEMSKMRY